MKNITFILTLVLSVFVGANAYAQETVPKEVLLTTLNGVNSLKLSNLKTTELMDYNKGYVDKVYDITESDKSDKDKKSALQTLSNDTEKDLIDLLGKKEYKKYVKLMEEQLEPLTKKTKLLKYLY
jgi:hypothetical protein